VELLAKVLHHVIALEFAVHQHIGPDLFLETDGILDFRVH
jgi:hypothetical protein